MREDRPITREEAKPLIIILSTLIPKSQDAHYDIGTTMITMKSHIQALEERAHAVTVRSAYFGQLAAESFPKYAHYVNVKLLTDWLTNKTIREHANENNNSPRLVDNHLCHFYLFSDNLLEASAVVNFTILNTDHPKQFMFHVVTNSANYAAMQAWFVTNDFKGSIIEVQKVEDLT
ncbi:putative polygalacturonate 4-alpha-galacturonosyltransferase [Helianthus annuus]|uniref:Polygalacturonate 4-alpha-galacturonosyltransferase n=1 Tax=Helianthus annuus TaxID=4232 RepID=A0A9K3J5N6_HELAN|nr:putative polygalacturonate 4-alpha-galacturonosyltransferase [Helianthus annuus]KAJ0580345.1 putative polygalacturonate 4-alpha-galacturonosyltransferase [Helianthus annuus]KAJ0596293.1 putative polygalacturonate 4-alpha-galacturonosyltransferase [Helianthus annuus]KAJ0926006.1 putative polygalacturonate 4-alpha-galacturonosyltransferase [Helianthus annuus]KAJ0930493.1 putative polygalacturonate 4-alpha-galacturonosyltransferase [Helianthus annuus]